MLGYISYGRKNKVGACLLELCSIHQMCVYICMYVCKVVGACSCSLKLVEVCFIHPVCVCVCVCVCVWFFPHPLFFLFSLTSYGHQRNSSLASQGASSLAPVNCQLYTLPQCTLDVKAGIWQLCPVCAMLVRCRAVAAVDSEPWWDAEQWLQWTVSPHFFSMTNLQGFRQVLQLF